MFASPLILLLILAAEDKPTPKVPVGKDTTFVSGPLDEDGYIDYEAALNEQLGKGITPEKNANALLWKALGPQPEMPPNFFALLGIEEPPAQGDYFIGLREYAKDRLKLKQGAVGALSDQQTRAVKRSWTAKDYPEIAEWLKANEKPLAIAVEATRRPDYFNPLVCPEKERETQGLIAAPLPSVQKCRDVANALAARAMFAVNEGKFDEAWQDLLACHRLGRLVARGGSLIESLAGIAINHTASVADLAYLERAPLSVKEVQDQLRELQGLSAMPLVGDKISLSERLVFLSCLQLVRRGGAGILEKIDGGRRAHAMAQMTLDFVDWEPAFRNANGWYDRLAAALRVQDRAQRELQLDKFEQDFRALAEKTKDPMARAKVAASNNPAKSAGEAIGNILITHMLPAARKIQNVADRAEQDQRNLHLAFALAAYRIDNGRYPPKLDLLAPKYVAAVPADLFSGKALIYHPSNGGYLLYSVGPNGKDDGGRWYDDDPPGDDPRIRMPLSDLRSKKEK
jgi:hypothetical protein